MFFSGPNLDYCDYCNNNFPINGKNFNNFIVTFDIKNNIKASLETNDYYYNHVIQNRGHENGVLRDIYDGQTYRKFVESLPVEDRDRYITFTFNCDGAPTFESSNFSIYPIQLIINELPMEARTKDTIVSTLWFEKSKPDMNVLLKAFVDDLSDSGLECCIEGEMRVIKPYAVCCAVDSVARYSMQGVKPYNSFYLCAWCLHSGQYVRNAADTGDCVKFPILKKEPKERNTDNFYKSLSYLVQKNYSSTEANEEHLEEVGNEEVLEDVDNKEDSGSVGNEEDDGNREVVDVANSEDEEIFDDTDIHQNIANLKVERLFGVQHVSPLNVLQKFNIIDGFVPEDMHFALLGIASQITEYWIRKLRPKELKVIDKLLCAVSVPHQTMRLSRSISERSYWKAKEWENWILYYSLPIMSLFLKKELLTHWSYFVEVFYIAQKPVITSEDLQRMDIILKSFLNNVEKLYTINAMTYNVHQLSHWSNSIENWGPSWAHNAFVFESGNGKIFKMIKAANGVTNQICRKLSMHQSDLVVRKSIFPKSSARVQAYYSMLENKST